MIDLMFLALVGVAGGIIVGLLPGIGPLSSLLMLYPWLINLNIHEIIVVYAALLTTVQYYSSIPAIVFGAMAEVTSGPAVYYGHLQFKKNINTGRVLLAQTATASAIATLISTALLVVVSQGISITWILSNSTRAIAVIVAIGLLVGCSQSRALGFVSAVIGILVGQLGYNATLDTTLIFPAYSSFETGLPVVPLIAGFLVIPALIEAIVHYRPAATSAPLLEISLLDRVRHALRLPGLSLFATLRGALIGSICGLIPGASYTISSSVAAALEKKFNPKSSNEILVIAAESANNAATTTALIPLLVLAVPVVASEAFVLSLLESKGLGVTTGYAELNASVKTVAGVIAASTIFNWLLAGVFYNKVIQLYQWMKKSAYVVAIITTVAVTLVASYYDGYFAQGIVTLVTSVVVGCNIKNFYYKSVALICVLMSDSVVNELYRFYLFYLL